MKGRYESIREALHPALILLFLGLPWLRTAAGPVMLFDFWKRHFVIFGFNFYSHEAPLLVYFLILLCLGVFIVTALFGRLWCGWACPQSVFLHSVFNRIERGILGPFARRQKFYAEKTGPQTQLRRLAVQAVYLAVCWVLAHSAAAYLIGADEVLGYLKDGPSRHLPAFAALTLISLALYFNFAFFREKLCTAVCPYGRFQNLLLDTNSVVVFYDPVRGEPRGPLRKGAEGGDCVACGRCVNVCPAGIDIREGFQVECISCGKCVDACNEVMRRLKKPPFLIRYETGDHRRIDWSRFRLALYGGLFTVFSAFFGVALAGRQGLDVVLTRAHASPFSERTEGAATLAQNQFQLHFKNQTNLAVNLSMTLADADRSRGFRLVSPAENLTLGPQQDVKLPLFVEIESSRAPEGEKPAEITLQFRDGTEVLTRKLQFVRAL